MVFLFLPSVALAECTCTTHTVDGKMVFDECVTVIEASVPTPEIAVVIGRESLELVSTQTAARSFLPGIAAATDSEPF